MAAVKALITGSHGFIGRHMLARLVRDGWDVDGYDIAAGPSGDALDLFRSHPTTYDLVIHCAAVSPHRSAIDGTPLTVGAGNLKLDAAMFSWAARTQPGRVAYISSSAVYPVSFQGRHVHRDLREDDADPSDPYHRGGPDAIYGLIKLTGEQLADAYRQQGGAVTVLRPFSGYGEDQSADFPFGAFIERARRRADPFVLWGDGEQVRDWVHVDDVVGATLAAAEQEVDGPLNVCTGVGTSMEELVELICREVGYSPQLEYHLEKPAGVAYRVGDPSRLREVYTPKVTLADGVRRALAGIHVG